MKKICLVVPCYNEEECINSFINAIDEMKKSIDSKKWNILMIFVDDGSKDKTLDILKGVNRKDVKYLSFSRNFGKESAMFAGLAAAKNIGADAAIIMDADLQDPPSLIPQMLEKYEEGYLHVTTKHREEKARSALMKACTKSFYWIFAHLTGFKNIKGGSRDFALLDKKVIDAYLSFNDEKRFTKGISEWVGFKTYCIEFDFVDRTEGNTKWNYFSLMKYAFEGIDAFSKFLLFIPRLCYLVLLILFIYFMVRDHGFNTCELICVVSFMMVVLFHVTISLLYKNRALLLNRERFFIQESNIEDLQ